jgi:hypoxanthine phosphoribosyltransferase
VPLRPLIDATAVQARVRELGAELSGDYPEGVTLIGVLKGSVLFLADLIRAMAVAAEVDFLAISSYAEGTGRVRIVKDLDLDIYGHDVILVEDIVDTGLTLNYILGELRRREPRSLEVCALLDKSVRRLLPVPVRYTGFSIDDDFVIGYGLDYAERYRNLDEVMVGDLAALRLDADAHVDELFPR